jgi:enoyl-CoA hydratase
MGAIQVNQGKEILAIKINRPGKYNALSIAMYHDLARAMERLNSDQRLRGAVIHAEGKHFTAGV